MRVVIFVSLLSLLLSFSVRQPAYVLDQINRSLALDSKLDPYSLKYQIYDDLEGEEQLYAAIPLASRAH